MNKINIGILGAMPEEIGETIKNLKNIRQEKHGDLTIYRANWSNINPDQYSIALTIAWSGWGKVSAARAATRLIAINKEEKLDLIIFTGVAGGIKNTLKQWDIVIPNEVVQHDFDAQPIFKKYFIPALGIDKIIASKKFNKWVSQILSKNLSAKELKKFGKIDNGLIATGDSFISDKNTIKELKKNLPNISAVEMEGAAVAQVAEQEKINWLIIRVISDNADESAEENFKDFLKEYSSLSWFIIKAILIGLEENKISINEIYK